MGVLHTVVQDGKANILPSHFQVFLDISPKFRSWRWHSKQKSATYNISSLNHQDHGEEPKLLTVKIQQNIVRYLWTDPKQLCITANILHQRSQLGFMHKTLIGSPSWSKYSSRLLPVRPGRNQQHQPVRKNTFPTLSSSIRRERRFQ